MLGFGHLRLGETFNKRLTLTVLLICLSQFNYGFDNQGYSTLQSMDYFEKQFGVWDAKKKTYGFETWWLSLFNSLIFVGLGLGLIIGSMISKRWGRRMCMFVMCIWAVICAIITVTSRVATQILLARTLNYGYIGMGMAVVPIFQSEIVPQQARGFVISTYQFMLGVGGIVINAVAFKTQHIESNASWQIPFGLFLIVPTFIAAVVWFVPESPRWLALQGRREEARKHLGLLREGKFTEEEIDSEFQMIIIGLEAETEHGSFRDMFRDRLTIRRTASILVVNFFFMATGNNFTTTYGAIFIKSLSGVNQFEITLINSCTTLVAVMMSMQLTDRIGRRYLLIVGGVFQAASMLAMAGIGTIPNPSYACKSAIVGMMIVFSAAFGFGFAPVVHTLSAELPSQKLRDITYRTACIVQIMTQFVVTFTLPYLLNAPYADLGAKVGFIYGSIAVLSVVYAAFCVPDCRNRSLEEIDVLFNNANIALRHFHRATIQGGAVADEKHSIEVEKGVNSAEIEEVR